jgi:hypothetical protein
MYLRTNSKNYPDQAGLGSQKGVIENFDIKTGHYPHLLKSNIQVSSLISLYSLYQLILTSHLIEDQKALDLLDRDRTLQMRMSMLAVACSSLVHF